MNKGKTTPEIVLQEHKLVVRFAPRQYQHLHPAQGSLRTSTHLFSIEKPLQNLSNPLSHTRNVLSLLKL